MGKIDTSSWGDFRVGDFEIIRCEPYHRKDVVFVDEKSDNSINYVTRTKFNNGVTGIILKDLNMSINPKNVITFGTENADFFYQDEEFIAGNNIYYININNLNKYSGLFLKTILQNTFSNNFNFTNGLIPKRIENETIKLPQTVDGDPDWEYMENFMRAKFKEAESKLKNYSKINDKPKTIDISNWGNFRFDIIFDDPAICERISSKDLDKNGKYPVYSSTIENGGIIGYTNKEPLYIINNEIPFVLIFGDHTKSMNFATKSFNILDNVKILKPKRFNIYEILFVITSWKKAIPDLGYSRHWSIAKEVVFKLPQTADGDPDWEYMENFMRAKFKENEEKLKKLKQINI